MSHRIVTEIEITAPTEEVWNILTDLHSYSEWNPFVVEASGDVEAGARLKVRLRPPGGSAMTIKPTVTEATTHQTFEWLGHLVIPGIFDGRHRFELERTSSGTRLTQSEEFGGILLPMLRRFLDTKTKAGFEAMNHALKDRTEGSVRESA